MAKARAARSGDFYSIRLAKHSGMIILGRTVTSVTRGTYEDCVAAYKAAQNHNFTLGWWGIISLIVYNPIAIFSNISAKKELDALAAAPSTGQGGAI